jgi:hypothetical protein
MSILLIARGHGFGRNVAGGEIGFQIKILSGFS